MKKIDEKKYGLLTAIDYKGSRGARVTYWCMFTFLILLCIISVVPVLYAFLSGFKELDEFYSTNIKLLPNKIEFSKMIGIINELNLGRSFINSMILFAIAWFGNVIVGGLAGYTISRLKPRGGNFLFKLMLWTLMMPGTLTMVPLFMTWADFPIIHMSYINTFVPFVVSAWANIFDILMFKNFFDGIPDSFIESAKLDGCGNVGIFLKIVFPLSMPIISTISIFSFTASWNNFMGPFLYLKDPKLAPVALKLYNTVSAYTEPKQLLTSFIVMLPTLVVFLLFSKKILSNDMSAGIKE